MAAKIKDQLSHQAAKIKDKLLENVYNYCKKTVEKIFQTYDQMNKTITTEPNNERELVAIRDFIKDTPNKVEQLSQELNEVYRHYCLLDDFSYKYADQDIETFWVQKQWPLEISSSLTDGGYMIQTKEVQFMSKLDSEKEQFVKSIDTFKQNLDKIKKFNNLENANEFASDAQQLRENLNNAFEKIKQFNDREALFNQPKSEYPDLEDINNTFKPFFELTNIASDVEFHFKDWTQSSLIKQDAAKITSSVA